MITDKISRLKSAFSSAVVDYWAALLICPALFLYVFSNDINIIALNGLIYRKICLNEYNQTICNSIHNFSSFSTHVQEISSEKMILLNIAFLVPAIFSIIHMASIGDRRLNYQLPLIVSLVGSMGQAFINIFATDQPYSVCLALLMFSQAVNGVCGGGSLAFISSCFSHISIYENGFDNNKDNLDTQLINDRDENEVRRGVKKYRSIRYSLCESCLLLGQFLGSFLSGYLIGNKIEIDKFKRTYVISFAIYLFVFIYTILMFKFLDKKKRDKNTLMSFSTSSLTIDDKQDIVYEEPKSFLVNLKNQFKFLPEVWNLLVKKRQHNARFHIISLLVLFFFGSSISLGIVSLQYLYLIKKPIALTQIDYGIYRALNTLFRAISLLIILPLLKHYFSTPDYLLFIIGLTSEFLNLIVFSVASVFKYAVWIGKT